MPDELSNFLEDLEGLRESQGKSKQIRDIVSIQEWLSPYYMGDTINYLYPYWKEVLIDIFQDRDKYPNELIFHGSIGTGKSMCAELAIFRLIYELTCYSNIPAKFNLPSISEIILMYLSVTSRQGERTGFGKLRRMIDMSPYMIEVFPRNTYIDSEIRFRNNKNLAIYPGSDVTHFMGGDLYAIILDEANFLRGAGDIGAFQKATDIYRESTNRRRSRFLVDGKEYGMSIVVSSVDTESSFVEERIRQAKNNPKKVKIYHSSLIDIKSENFSKKKFYVQYKQADVDYFILEPDNKPLIDQFYKTLGYKDIKKEDYVRPMPGTELFFIGIPINFYDTFLVDLPNSLKEVAGVVIRKSGKLFYAKSRWDSCIDKDRHHPFSKESFEVSTSVDSNELIELFDASCLKRGETYFIHTDQSTTTDDTGVGMSHCEFNVLNQLEKVVVDLMLKIVAPKVTDAQIDIGKIREFFLYLRKEKKIKIGYWSYDSYASEESLQIIKKKGIECGRLSLDRDDKVYKMVVRAILKGGTRFYRYKPLEEEFFDLNHDRDKRKVAHPPGSDKGVADGFTGSIYNAVIHMSEALKQRNIADNMSAFHSIREEEFMEMQKQSFKRREDEEGHLFIDEKLEAFLIGNE